MREKAAHFKISKYTVIILPLATYSVEFHISTGLPNMLPDLVPNLGFGFYFTAVISLVTGTMFYKASEQITERGIGNGISLIIFACIACSLPSVPSTIYATTWQMVLFSAFVNCSYCVCVTYFVAFVERDNEELKLNTLSVKVKCQILEGISSY